MDRRQAHTSLGFFQWCRIHSFCFPNGLWTAIRIVPNGLQFIPRVPTYTTAAFILQPLPKNWNFLVLVFSRIRSKPMWTLGKVDYAWVRPYWYPASYSPSWTYHLAKGTHQPTYLLILGCEWTDRWSRSCSWCWFFENELSLSPSLQPGVQMLNISQSNDPTEKAQCRPCFPRLYGKKQPVGDMQEIVLLSIDDVHWHHSRILATKNIF